MLVRPPNGDALAPLLVRGFLDNPSVNPWFDRFLQIALTVRGADLGQ